MRFMFPTTDEQGVYVSALLASSQYIYAGTTVGVIGVWSSEGATLLQVFHYHEHKVRMLLEIPLQVSPCVCPEVLFPKDRIDDNMENDYHLITIALVANGLKKLLLHPNTNEQGNIKQLQQHKDDKCLLTWKYSRTSIIQIPVCHFNVKGVQINEFIQVSELSDKIHYLAS